jgi:hypothetical protein
MRETDTVVPVGSGDKTGRSSVNLLEQAAKELDSPP